MTKNKSLIIQLLLSVLAIGISSYFFIFTPYYIYNDPSFALGLVYSSSSILIIVYDILAFMLLPVLFVIVYFRKNQATSRLDKIIKYFLYTGAIALLVALLYNFVYSFTQVPELVISAYNEDKYFLLKIFASIFIYLIPAGLFYISAKLPEFTGSKKSAL